MTPSGGDEATLSDAEAGARFTRVFEDTYSAVLAYALRRTVNRSDAEDVVASTYLVAWRRLEELLAAEAPIAWLYGVALRTLANQRRTQRRAAALKERLESDPPGAVPDRAAGAAESADELADVVRALGTLKERDQEVLRLSAFEDLSAAEIGEVLGVSPGVARSILFRARRRLQRALDTERRRERGGGV